MNTIEIEELKEKIRLLQKDLANRNDIIRRWHRERIGEVKANKLINEIVYAEGKKCYVKVTLPLPPSTPKSVVWEYAPKTYVDEDKTALFKEEVLLRGDRWYVVYRTFDLQIINDGNPE